MMNSQLNERDIATLLVEEVIDYAIFALDPNGHILTWNKGAQNLKGYKHHEILGQHFSIFYTEPDITRRHPDHELQLAIENGRYAEEGWRVRKDGTTFWASVVITALRDVHGHLRGFAKVTRDLTERKVAEDNLRRSYELLEERVNERTAALARAVKSRDEFLSIASHELKTPLTSLRLQSQMRIRNLDKGRNEYFSLEKLRKYFESDEKHFERLGNLIEDMLDIAVEHKALSDEGVRVRKGHPPPAEA